MKEEMTSIEENMTWSLVNLPKGHHAIGLKWVFKLKRDENGNIVRHKASLIVKGYVQRQGIDFDEVFAPVVLGWSPFGLCLHSGRSLRLVGAPHGHQVCCLEWRSCRGSICSPATRIHGKGRKCMILRLHKTLDGLQQAPRAWNSKLDESLCKLGFTCCRTEHGLNTRLDVGARMIVGVYVDDLLVVGESSKDIGRFKKEMMQTFSMSDLGNLSYYVGIEVK
jgi:hypothetical protein